MKITKLQLENFRSYQNFFFEFPEDQNLIVLVGENGLGKTNLLEAVYALSLGKSFRSSHLEDLIKWENDFYRCQCKVNTREDEVALEMFYSNYPRRQKSFKKNGVKTPHTKYLGNLLTVLFQPEDLNMLYLSPSLRRKYLDIVLSQTDPYYLNALSKYRKTLRHRNALLQQIRENRFKNLATTSLIEDLDVWDQEIAKFGTEILRKRQKYTEFLQKHLTAIYQSISETDEKVAVYYSTKINADYLQTLAERREKDLIRGETTAGPHRDDLLFELNDVEITRSASRGEFRTILLAIKLAEIQYIQEMTGQNPILLLDDVFSELDLHRQQKLLEMANQCQTIITTTDTQGLDIPQTSILDNIIDKK